ncbi:PucR family transcriptional regulator [Streptomyces sp. NPDC059460]|uniref:PucR family transcriptional regulator n=1 Tax=Streptomyces sp. NPDC059460 TaxID=3346840 RepID=UPI0036CBA0F7
MSDTSVPLRWLLGQHDLGLRLLAGRDDLDREVSWAHSIELADPTPWLGGGELLLTTGLRLPEDDAGRSAYVRRLADTGVAALGFGTGLSHPRVPPAVVQAAEECGLPLLEVPLPTPFVAVTKAVMERLAELQYEGVSRASRIQPRMTRAALRGGPQAVVRELAVSTRSSVVLLDDAGAVRASHPAGTASADTAVAALLHGAPSAPSAPGDACGGSGARLGDAASAAVSSGRHRVVALQRVQVGARAHGQVALVTDRPLTAVDHLLLGHAASLIALEAEKPLRLREEQNRVNAMFLRMLLDGSVAAPAARDHLGEAGFSAPERLRVLVLRGTGPQRALAALGQALAERGLLRFGLARAGCAVLLLDTGVDAAALVAEAASGLRPRPWAGVSAEHGPAEAPTALREAMTAAEAAQARQCSGVVAFAELAGHELLAEPHTRAVLQRLAADRLAPLADHDARQGTELVASLRAFLENHGQWEAASTALGVHRHTLRARVERVQLLLPADLESAHVRAELLLALSAWPTQ